MTILLPGDERILNFHEVYIFGALLLSVVPPVLPALPVLPPSENTLACVACGTRPARGYCPTGGCAMVSLSPPPCDGDVTAFVAPTADAFNSMANYGIHAQGYDCVAVDAPRAPPHPVGTAGSALAAAAVADAVCTAVSPAVAALSATRVR